MSLLQCLVMVLSFLYRLVKSHPEWRNPITVCAYFGYSIYQNFYNIAYLHIWKADYTFAHNQTAHKWSAIVVWTVFAFLTLFTIGSWLYTFLIGNIRARWLVRSLDFFKEKSIMEVDSYTGERFWCARCPRPHYQGNR